jgi:hypothetical protein
VRGRRSGEAAEGTNKRSLLAVPLDRNVRWLCVKNRHNVIFAVSEFQF